MSDGIYSPNGDFISWVELHQIINCRNVNWRGLINLVDELMQVNSNLERKE